jgi:fatty acid desaturase
VDDRKDLRGATLVAALGRIAGAARSLGTPKPGDIELSPAALRVHFSDQFKPEPVVYWADMLASAAIGWGAFALAATRSLLDPVGFVATVVAMLALYRAALFIHELSHLGRGAIPGFEAVWNVLVGIPMMVPSLMYVGSHNEHHKKAVFGTPQDPEYDPIAFWSPSRIVLSTATMLFVPALLLFRWGILGPLSSVIPPLRKIVVEQASTLVINTSYHRAMPTDDRMRMRWFLQETGAAIFCWSMAVAMFTGVIPVSLLVTWYLVAVGLLMVNHVRTLAAHRYDNDGGELDDAAQLLDSVNVIGPPWLTALAAPVGLRYHALHHLLPALPYHSLGRVHRALMAGLPADSDYRLTEARGIIPATVDLLERAARHRAAVAATGSGQYPSAPM